MSSLGSSVDASARRSGRKRVAPVREFPPPKPASTAVAVGQSVAENSKAKKLKTNASSTKNERGGFSGATSPSKLKPGLMTDSLKSVTFTAAGKKTFGDFDEIFHEEFENALPRKIDSGSSSSSSKLLLQQQQQQQQSSRPTALKT